MFAPPACRPQEDSRHNRVGVVLSFRCSYPRLSTAYRGDNTRDRATSRRITTTTTTTITTITVADYERGKIRGRRRWGTATRASPGFSIVFTLGDRRQAVGHCRSCPPRVQFSSTLAKSVHSPFRATAAESSRRGPETPPSMLSATPGHTKPIAS